MEQREVHLDARQIRVLAHPLRFRLLGRLRIDGPAHIDRERVGRVRSEPSVDVLRVTPLAGDRELYGIEQGGPSPEWTLGDDCTLNAGSVIQCHSQEDGAFKSDRSALGAGVTVGVGALVHYGVSVGDAVAIESDSFVMKGEEVPAGAHWGGNPAQDLGEAVAAAPDRAPAAVGAHR